MQLQLLSRLVNSETNARGSAVDRQHATRLRPHQFNDRLMADITHQIKDQQDDEYKAESTAAAGCASECVSTTAEKKKKDNNNDN